MCLETRNISIQHIPLSKSPIESTMEQGQQPELGNIINQPWNKDNNQP
jgi:hypothetical protein